MTEQQMDQRINHPVCEGKGWDNPKKKKRKYQSLWDMTKKY